MYTHTKNINIKKSYRDPNTHKCKKYRASIYHYISTYPFSKIIKGNTRSGCLQAGKLFKCRKNVKHKVHTKVKHKLDLYVPGLEVQLHR